MGVAFKDGNFALAEVKYAAGDIKPMVIESVGTAQKRVEIRVDNIAGVKVPVFKSIDTGAVSQDHTGASPRPCAAAARRSARDLEAHTHALSPPNPPLRLRSSHRPSASLPRCAGLSKGGQQIARARTTFAKAVDVLVQLATLQTSFVILDEAIKVRTSPYIAHPHTAARGAARRRSFAPAAHAVVSRASAGASSVA